MIISSITTQSMKKARLWCRWAWNIIAQSKDLSAKIIQELDYYSFPFGCRSPRSPLCNLNESIFQRWWLCWSHPGCKVETLHSVFEKKKLDMSQLSLLFLVFVKKRKQTKISKKIWRLILVGVFTGQHVWYHCFLLYAKDTQTWKQD